KGHEDSFGSILVIPPVLSVEPVNQTNSIIIEKIDVNTPVVWDIDVTNKTAYNNALASGVAHAAGTQHPSDQNGNTYLFAHSTLNPLEIERYAAVFTLLHRLEAGDRITVFSENVRYDYAVESVEVVNSFNVEPLTRQPDYPMLTLQTCDPPGIPLNRLIVTAKLIQKYEN
ncbi:sortase, partial [candidate division WWE3 bacterium]|nr:sortase [candidate division WWE3 bacterium]